MNKFLQTTFSTLTITSLALTPLSASAMSQEETVYAKLQPTGVASQLTVTKHLLNDTHAAELHDRTTLEHLENINGFESHTLANGQLTWQAGGADIYYSGETSEQLPVTVDVIYKLNDAVKPLAEILGQSGQVEITLHYHNSAKVGNLYTPFVVAMATTLPADSVHNLSVTNGQIICNGRNFAVTAIAAPGLYESLGLAELKDFDKITLRFETDKFELSDIYSVVTPKLLDQADLKIFSEVDQLSSDIEKLSASSQELVAGSNRLRDGIQELRDALLKIQKQLEVSGSLLTDEALDQISAAASLAARRELASLQPSIDQQVSAEVDAMMSELGLGLSSIEQQALATKIKSRLSRSVYQQMEQVAAETASSTARSVASQVAGSAQAGLGSQPNLLVSQLLTSVNQLLVGANQLSSGMQKFDTEGIQQLSHVVNHKLKATSDRVKRLTKLAADYDNFSGIADGVDGTTKFILMIDAQKKQ